MTCIYDILVYTIFEHIFKGNICHNERDTFWEGEGGTRDATS